MNKELVAEFQNPGSDYRGAPFWAWNGKLDQQELRAQIRLMHEMGLGGFFMHSRVGLDTAYLSNEWFDCVKACVDEARKLKMNAWLYDEDRWPSGAAGGLVTKNPKYRMRSIMLTVITDPAGFKWSRDIVAAFTAKVDEKAAPNVATDIKQLKRGSRIASLESGSVILVFTVKVDDCSSWFNGQTYLDTMNREAVAAYIKSTHEAYKKKIGSEFAKTVPGIFTDEPHHGKTGDKTADGKNIYPWTEKLPAVFRKRYGYDLLQVLPHLFYKVDGNPLSHHRYHYNDCITHLFVDSFARQVGEWCEKNKIMFTGHVLEEDTLTSQTQMVGSCMRFYEHMQAPGMDLLTEHWRIYDTAKQVTSAARQFGRKWRLTETYGCTGWDFPFVGHKALGDWQTALGINLRCQHLAWYTMQGEAKRDYPAAIFYQSTWWNLYSKVEDYFARIYSVMTRGTEVRDLLVIHPVESMWLVTRKNWSYSSETAAQLSIMIRRISDSLLMDNIDFDYGDEELMSRHADVVMKNGAAVLKFGKAEYKAVIVPPLKTIRASTLRLLQIFQAKGGLVVFAGEPPALLDAMPSAAALDFASRCVNTAESGPDLALAVEEKARRISITDGQGRNIPSTLHLLREDAENFYLFVCNTGHTTEQCQCDIKKDTLARDRSVGFENVRITGFADCAGKPLLLDPESGRMFTADYERHGEEIVLKTSLPPSGSRLFIIQKEIQEREHPALPSSRVKVVTALTPDSWPVTLSESNVIVLDKPEFRIENGGWQTARDVLQADFAVKDAMGIHKRGGSMIQPWAQKKEKNPVTKKVTLRYTFKAEAQPSGDLYLGLEMPETFEITINGTTLSRDLECGWWCDKSLRKVRLEPSLVRTGTNELIMVCDYNMNHSGLEFVYLLGNFGVKIDGAESTMTRQPDALRIGDWVEQGLPFFAGSVAYRTTIQQSLASGERLFVRVPEYRGVALRILVDGTPAGIVGWEPNEVDITELANGRKVELAIEVIGHRRNSHGPLHLNEKWPAWTGPSEFSHAKSRWQADYQLVPCGLMKTPELVVKSAG